MTSYSHKSDLCCSKVILDGSEDLTQKHGDKLGIYEMVDISNAGNVFKLTGSEYYLHRSASMKWVVSKASYIYCSKILARLSDTQR